jgi:hypothetical protein
MLLLHRTRGEENGQKQQGKEAQQSQTNNGNTID